MSTISNKNYAFVGERCMDCTPALKSVRRQQPMNRQISRQEPSNYENVMAIAEKISVLALGVLSAMADFKLFLPFFIAGLGYGIYSAVTNQNGASHQIGSACSQGFLEQITGIGLPRPVSLLANVAITACHIDHHSSVFVPVTALSFGAWIGKIGLEFSRWASQQVSLA